MSSEQQEAYNKHQNEQHKEWIKMNNIKSGSTICHQKKKEAYNKHQNVVMTHKLLEGTLKFPNMGGKKDHNVKETLCLTIQV
jgi:hypothetical protein